jgi:putative transposase
MPRRHRVCTADQIFHVLNRSVRQQTIFERDFDYQVFLDIMEETRALYAVRILAYCVMPTHWHLVLWPERDRDLSDFMHRLTTTHARRWHGFHHTDGAGPLYQGRFKAFPVETDEHFYRVCRYAERNPLRAGLVSQAEAWRWSSLWQRQQEQSVVQLSAWPLPCPPAWVEYVNQVETEAELAALRLSVRRGTPYGSPDWQLRTATELGLESTLRSRGRPRR